MKDHTMILILVIAFFMLGCRFSCSGMKEDFSLWPTADECTQANSGCNASLITRCQWSHPSKVACAPCKCGFPGAKCPYRCYGR
jgi:hypothetical protein